MNVFLGYFLHKYCYDENNIWDEVAVKEAKIFVVQNSRPTIVFEKKRIDELSIGMESTGNLASSIFSFLIH